ncbi:hypothetical protein Tco_1188275 [Tanacetum coccineum]
MSTIIDIRCVLTQEALNAFCEAFHIPEELHPTLPSHDDTMHERPARKIGLYTRFFDFANFRLPLSTFLVDILRHFRINISQLSVIESAKVSHFEILCRVCGIEPTVGLFRCFYVNSKKSGWLSFSKRSDNARVDDFACPARFPWHTAKNITKDPAPIVEMDLFTFIHTPDPSKVNVVERGRNENEPPLLQTTIRRTVPLLPVAPDRAKSELEASVDKLFDEGGSGYQTDQGDSVGGTGNVHIQPVSEAVDTTVEDMAPLQPRRQRKRKAIAVDAGEPSHPPKTLRNDHGAPIGVSVEHEGGDHTDFVTGTNTCTVRAPQRFVISSDSSHHSGANVTEAEVDSLTRSSIPVMTTATTVTATVDAPAVTNEKHAAPLLFAAGSSSVGGTDPTPGGFSNLTSSDFLVGGIRTVIDPDSDIQKMVDEFATPKFFASVHRMKHDELFAEFNVGAAQLLKAREKEIGDLKAQLLMKEAEVAEAIRLCAEASKFEDVKVADLAASVKVKEQEASDLDAMVTSVRSQNDNLVDQAGAGLQEKVTAYENCISELEKYQDGRMKEVNDKFDKLDTDLVEMALHRPGGEILSSSFDHHFWPAAIGKAVEKGMQDGLFVRIAHGVAGRALTDVAAYNPSAEADYLSALQPDGSHTSFPDQLVIGASALSLLLDVSSSKVRKIKENIASHKSALRDVFLPLSEPLSVTALTGTGGTSNVIPATVDTTTALPVTFASTSLIPSISTDDYEILHTDGQDSAGADANPFLNVDEAELNIS